MQAWPRTLVEKGVPFTRDSVGGVWGCGSPNTRPDTNLLLLMFLCFDSSYSATLTRLVRGLASLV